jgi:hypothetical protein
MWWVIGVHPMERSISKTTVILSNAKDLPLKLVLAALGKG